MKKHEKDFLRNLAKRFTVQANLSEKWIKRNRKHCGHSNGPQSLGDEGWNRLFEENGREQAFRQAAYEIKAFLVRTRVDKEPKK